MNLTRTGSFLGTPLYASPEQIKGEPLDARADVYSVAATLYFLLSGKAPFEGGDAEATLAKIVTLSATSIRYLVPEIPRALDAVILKGLERNRERRYRDLDEMSEALLPFVPSRLSITGVGIRLLAFIGDVGLTRFLGVFLFEAVHRYETGRWASTLQALLVATVFDLMFWIGFFVLAEGTTGSSPFKYFLRMKVYCQERASIPGLGKSLKRTAILYAFLILPVTILAVYSLVTRREPQFFLVQGLRLAGLAVICSTMRSSNDYRGLHEIWSGTRVVRLPSRRQVATAAIGRWPRRAWLLTKPDDLPKTLGNYEIEGAIRWDDHIRILQAIDLGLGRHAWILLHPQASGPLPASRQATNRLTRPRWLAAGTFTEWRWDAFVAPVGRPLADLVTPRSPFSWQEMREILAALTEELIESIATDSLPASLGVGQVFVQPDGRIQLIDEDPLPTPETTQTRTDSQTLALGFIHEVAILGLTGRPVASAETTKILGPIPLHARAILDRLRPGPGRYPTVVALQADFQASRNLQPDLTRTSRLLRAGIFVTEVVASILLASVPVGMVMAATAMATLGETSTERSFYEALIRTIDRYVAVLPLAIPLAWIGWVMATRGGLTRPLLGLSLARPDGQPVSRLRCAVREGIVWGYVGLVFHLAFWPTLNLMSLPLPFNSKWILLLLPFYAIWGIFSGKRMPHEWISGNVVVPR